VKLIKARGSLASETYFDFACGDPHNESLPPELLDVFYSWVDSTMRGLEFTGYVVCAD
jgi:hypothetical protein